jgi:hypothetical protein
MDELLIAAAVLAVVLYFGSPSKPSLLVSTPANSPPASPLVSFDGSATSGGYQLTSAATNLSTGGYSPRLASLNSLFLGTFIAPPPVPQPSPWVSGGISGTAGSGGNPLGSALRPGLSSGTGTTSLNRLLRPVAL